MSNTKLRELTEISSAATGDFLEVVDVSDTTFGSNGTNKQITKTNFLNGFDVDSLTATAAELNALDGITATVTELNYTDGVTSAIQTQLDAKEATIALTASRAVVSTAGGILGVATTTATEIGYVNGVTSAIQTQLNAKAASGANSDITSLAGLTTPLSVAQGGIGVATNTAYAVLCGGTTGTAAVQSIASVGDSGQVLTSNGAGALPTFQAISNVGLIERLDWSNVVLPDANFPSIGKTVGTNWVYKTLDFDPTTDEACYWFVHIPTSLSTITSAKLVVHWTASAGTADQACYWQVTTRSIGDDQAIDAVATPTANTDAGNDALIATGDEHRLDITLTTTDWNAGETLQIKLNRDADNGSDNLTGDAKVMNVILEIT